METKAKRWTYVAFDLADGGEVRGTNNEDTAAELARSGYFIVLEVDEQGRVLRRDDDMVEHEVEEL